MSLQLVASACITRVNSGVSVGIKRAPVKPAEFVIFRISQYTPGAES